MAKISKICKITMIEGFEFTNSELFQIESFIDRQGGKTAKEILDDLIKNKTLNSKQKIVISYVVGNSVGHEAEKGPANSAEIDTSYIR